jgi:hypothetical protein
MRPIAAIAATLVALSAPAFAQDAGAPGATGAGGPLVGSNTGSGYAPNYDYGPYPNGGYYGPGPNGGYYGPGPSVDYGYGQNGYDTDAPVVVEGPMYETGPNYGPAPYGNGPGPYYGPGPDNRADMNRPGMIEGRASAPDEDSAPAPRVRHKAHHHRHAEEKGW